MYFNLSRGSVLSVDKLHVDNQTKYSGGNDSFVKMIKNTGGGWQCFFKSLAGKELKTIPHSEKIFKSPMQCHKAVQH